MTGRIVEDADVAVRGRLVVGADSAELEDAGLCGVNVADREVQVELLRVSAAGPGRRHPVIDPLKGERGASVGMVRADTTAGRSQGGPAGVRPALQLPPSTAE